MDLENSVDIFCSNGKSLFKDAVNVNWSKDFCMKQHPKLHKLIEETWTQKSEKCKNLFNASKFRLHKVELHKSSDGNIPAVTLHLGSTSYKEFIGTNCATYAAELVRDGIDNFSNSQAYLADPLGVGSIIETTDENLIFMRRSLNLAEMQGMIDRPGGHPEPDEVEKSTGHELCDKDAAFITAELFDSVLKEVRDEINIPLEKLSQPTLLGISYNPYTWKRPSAEFYVKCYLSAAEVHNLYKQQTQAESEESTELIIIPLSDVLKMDFLQKSNFYKELTPAAQSALYLFNIFHSKAAFF
ncbi:uridine diphosphate glucose pyrophosphatase NUDT22-like [Uloborus diversus]|uniref:uridine diphosphate glucose pyrophosphatase NUDT22-like n=1 Tax=Uloborus diversus TaxID=327109 RepID=UPI0024090CBE|nr:uridine diphosphate glucose pyrophosphatase NUDT22-like [Uloborus diversus]